MYVGQLFAAFDQVALADPSHAFVHLTRLAASHMEQSREAQQPTLRNIMERVMPQGALVWVQFSNTCILRLSTSPIAQRLNSKQSV